MSTTPIAPVNGAQKKTAVSTTAEVKPEPKKEPLKKEDSLPETKIVSLPTPHKEQNDLPPLEDRLLRLNQLFDLQRKYNQLKATQQKLNDFDLNHNPEDAHITFEDEDNNEFTTSNPEIMKDFLQFLKQTIAEKIKIVEAKLVW